MFSGKTVRQRLKRRTSAHVRPVTGRWWLRDSLLTWKSAWEWDVTRPESRANASQTRVKREASPTSRTVTRAQTMIGTKNPSLKRHAKSAAIVRPVHRMAYCEKSTRNRTELDLFCCAMRVVSSCLLLHWQLMAPLHPHHPLHLHSKRTGNTMSVS